MNNLTREQVEAIKQTLTGYWYAHRQTFDGSGPVAVCESWLVQEQELRILKTYEKVQESLEDHQKY